MFLGLKNLSFETFYLIKYNEAEHVERARVSSPLLRANWLNGAYTDEDIVDVFDENLTEPLELTDTVAIPPGSYHFARHQVSFGTDPSRAFAFQTPRQLGGGGYGGERNVTARLFVKPNEHVYEVSLIEDYNVVRLPQGDFNLSLFSPARGLEPERAPPLLAHPPERQRGQSDERPGDRPLADRSGDGRLRRLQPAERGTTRSGPAHG